MKLLIRLSSAAFVVLIAVLVTKLFVGDDFSVSPEPEASISATPMSAQESCAVAVMGLLAQSLQAMQQGYQNGLDPNQVAAQYGAESVVFKVFVYSQATLAGNVISQGAGGQLTAIQPQVRERCQEAR